MILNKWFQLEVFLYYIVTLHVFIQKMQDLKLWIPCFIFNCNFENSRIRVVRSSERVHARAWISSSHKFLKFYSPLERPKWRLSEDPFSSVFCSSDHRAWISCIQHFCRPLEWQMSRVSDHLCFWTPLKRRKLRSSGDPIFSKILPTLLSAHLQPHATPCILRHLFGLI